MSQNKPQKVIMKTDKEFYKTFCETLFRKKSIKLTGIGIFQIKKSKAMTKKHPRYGIMMDIPAHYRITFRASKTIKAKLKHYEFYTINP